MLKIGEITNYINLEICSINAGFDFNSKPFTLLMLCYTLNFINIRNPNFVKRTFFYVFDYFIYSQEIEIFSSALPYFNFF